MLNAYVTLPLDIDGEVVTVELAVEYEYTKGYPGNYGCPAGEADPPTPPEVSVIESVAQKCNGVPVTMAEEWDDLQNAVDRRVAAGWPELERRLLEAAENL